MPVATVTANSINDLPEICAREDPSSEIFLYADDSKIYKVIRNQSDQQKLQTILNMIKSWSDEWEVIK